MSNNVSAINEATLNATEKNENEPAKVENAIAIAPTAHVAEISGLDILDDEDIATSRVKLLHPMSDEASNGEKAGTWYNTLSGENYGDSFQFTVISLWKSRTYFSEDRSESPICRSPDGFASTEGHKCKIECPHNAAKWINRVAPPCKEQYNFMILPVKGGVAEGFPSIVTLMKSSHNSGKKLYTLIVAARSPVWYWAYELSASQVSNNRGTYYVADVRKVIADGKPVATSDEVRHIAETFRRMKQEGRIQVADEEETPVTPAQPVEAELTDDQRKQIIEMINAAKISHQEFEQMCRDEFSKEFDKLSKSEGAELLNRLMSAEPTADDGTPF